MKGESKWGKCKIEERRHLNENNEITETEERKENTVLLRVDSIHRRPGRSNQSARFFG